MSRPNHDKNMTYESHLFNDYLINFKYIEMKKDLYKVLTNYTTIMMAVLYAGKCLAEFH